VSSAAQDSWRPAWHCTVIGAAHRRKGVVCQDFSLVRQLQAPSGGCLQLLAVADGHGGERYRHSATGSRLACEQAAQVVDAALQSVPLDDLPTWERLLAEGLPDAIQRRWLQAIQRHWQQEIGDRHGSGAGDGAGAGAGEPFCSSLYGSTLGLLLLAPTWWGCTGLGDWDLVRVDSDGNLLLSEETHHPGAGEATASLCLTEASSQWAERAQLQAIPAFNTPFSLVISTDGVRKSCATDEDYLELCSQIVGIQDTDQLMQGLAEISATGSGDDLSIAVGRWSPSAGQTTEPRRAVALPPVNLPSRRRGLPLSIVLLLPVALAIGAVVWFARPQGWSWFPPGQTPPKPLDALLVIQQEAERLCSDPALIAGTLSQRRQQFSQLRNAASERQDLLAMADQDPLGALIAWSQPPLTPPPLAETLQNSIPPSSRERPLTVPGSCPALDQALAGQWRSHARPSAPPSVHTPGPPIRRGPTELSAPLP
jgi:hypothetical protein